jgi:3-hydroxyisobutyrate dehydrogenase
MIGVCEALLYSSQTGLEPARLIESISGGAAGCWTLEHLAPRIQRRDFAAGFFVDHFLKDMAIALEESRRMGLWLPGLDLVHRLYQTVQELGHGRSGTHALILALEHLSRQDPTSSK